MPSEKDEVIEFNCGGMHLKLEGGRAVTLAIFGAVALTALWLMYS